MTRLFGCICNQPQRLADAIAQVRKALVAPAPVNRWGLGYVHSGEVLLSLQPRPAPGAVDMGGRLAEMHSDYVIGWSTSDDTWAGDANTQPYRFRRWFFAQEHSGPSPEDMARLQPAIWEHVPEFLQRTCRGRSPSELLFHLFMAMLHDSGTIDDPNLDPIHVRQTLSSAVTLSQQIAKSADIAWPMGNIVISNSRSMLAARYQGPMLVRQIHQTPDARRPESELNAVLVISGDASDANGDGDGFEELAQGTALAIHRDVTTEVLGALNG